MANRKVDRKKNEDHDDPLRIIRGYLPDIWAYGKLILLSVRLFRIFG